MRSEVGTKGRGATLFSLPAWIVGVSSLDLVLVGQESTPRVALHRGRRTMCVLLSASLPVAVPLWPLHYVVH